MSSRSLSRAFLALALLFASGLGLRADVPPDSPSTTKPSQKSDAPEAVKPQSKASTSWSDSSNFLKRIAWDQKQIWTFPVRLRTQDLNWALPLAGVTGASIAYDPEIAREFSRSGAHASTARTISNASAASLGALALAQYGFGRHLKNSRMRESGTLAMEAMVNSFIVTESLGYALGRQRPFQGNGQGDFFSGGASFPSGHSTAAWAAASVIAHEYPGWITQASVYTLAATTSAMRVAGEKHWLSDVLVGGAIGYFSGKEIYRLHHVDDYDSASNWGTFDKSKKADDEPVVGSTYVPSDSWVYPLFDRLAALGYIPLQADNMRPWTRQECYRLVREADSLLDNDSDRQVVDILRVLKREFANEALVTPGLRTEAALESVYAHAVGSAGPVLRESYHYGETITNDYGRPYGQGGSFDGGISARAIAGRFSIYFRGEYQHGAGSQTLPLAARQFIAVANQGVPVPSGEYPTVDRLALLESYVGVAGGGFEFTAGKQSLWWGPNRGGPLLFSNNAEPIYMLRLTRPQMFKLPGFLSGLGRWNVDLFFGEVVGHRNPYNTMIHGEKITWNPTKNLELGFSRTTLFGGSGVEPLTWRTMYNTYFSVGDNPFSDQTKADPGDRRGGFDFSYRVPGLRNWLTIYTDSFTDDDPSPFAHPRRAVFSPGIYLPKLPYLNKFEFRAEAPYTDTPDYSNIPFGAFIYSNGTYKDGYVNPDKIIGSWVGRRNNGYQAWLSYWASPTNKIELSYRGLKWSNQYLPGGGTQNDFAAAAVWRVKPEVEIQSKVQFERWLLPILAQDRQQNWSGMIQLTWYPSKVYRRGSKQ
jgi:membrane-associated phospholipid phosphatase